MRRVKTMEDVQAALNELYNFRDSFSARNINLNGRKIVGGDKATRPGEYVTFEQIPAIKDKPVKHKEQFYTIVFDEVATLTDGELIPPYVVGSGREGILHQVWVQALTAPSGGPLSINIQVTTIDTQTTLDVDTSVLDVNLSLPSGQTRRVYSSTFITTVPKLQQLCWLRPLIISANSAALVSIGVVVQRF